MRPLKIKIVRDFLFLVFLFIGFIQCKKEGIENKSQLLDKSLVFSNFQPLWKLYLESSKGGWTNNDNGRFSNDEAPALDAFVELYILTHDQRYLDTIYKIGTKILNNDDIARNLKDVHRGNKVLPGWSSTRYTHDKSRTIFLMDDALILLPMLKAHNILKNSSNRKYAPETWLSRAESEFQEVFIPNWIKVSDTEGYFEDPYYTKDSLNMPMNQYAMVGLLCLELFKATGELSYRDYAIKTGNYLKKNLIKINNQSYVWYYKLPSTKYPGFYYDDFSHAQLIVRFVEGMYKSNIIFDENDMKLLVGTFKYQVMDDNKIFRFFGGKFNANTYVPSNEKYVGDNAWLTYFHSLAAYDNGIKNILNEYHITRKVNFNRDSEFNHIAEFVLLHYVYKLKFLQN